MSFYRSDFPPSLCDWSCEGGTDGPHKGFMLWSVAFTKFLFTGAHCYHITLIFWNGSLLSIKRSQPIKKPFSTAFLDRDKWIENNCIRIVRSRSVIWLGRVRSGMHEGDEKYRPNIREPGGRTWLGGPRRRLKV